MTDAPKPPDEIWAWPCDMAYGADGLWTLNALAVGRKFIAATPARVAALELVEALDECALALEEDNHDYHKKSCTGCVAYDRARALLSRIRGGE